MVKRPKIRIPRSEIQNSRGPANERDALRRPSRSRSISVSGRDACPGLLPGALGDGLADADLAVAVGEGGEVGGAGAARGDEVVERQVELLEGVGEALGVAAGIMAGLAGFGREQGGVAVHERVGPAAAAEPEVLGRFAV